MSSIPDVSKVNYNGVLYNVKDAVTRGKMDEVEAARQQAIQDIQAEGQTQTGAVTAEGTAQKNAVTAEGTRVLGTIPNDYTALAGDVGDLKGALTNTEKYTRSELNNGEETFWIKYQGSRNASGDVDTITAGTTRCTSDVFHLEAGETIVLDNIPSGYKCAIAGKYDDNTTYDSGWKTGRFYITVTKPGTFFVNAAKSNASSSLTLSDVSSVTITIIGKNYYFSTSEETRTLDYLIAKNHNYINYGYDKIYSYDYNPNATDSSAVGLFRDMQHITINGGGISRAIYIKINGSVQKSIYSDALSRTDSAIVLKSGHQYKFTLEWISGEITGVDPITCPSITVYKGNATSTSGTWSISEDGKTFTRIVNGDGGSYIYVIYIPAGMTFSNANFIALLEDLSAQENPDFDYFNQTINNLHGLVDYGYGNRIEEYAQNTAAPDSGTAVGVKRLGTTIELNYESTSAPKRVRISGEIARNSGNSTYKSWVGNLQLTQGKEYRYKIQKLSGTGTLNSANYIPYLVVYESQGATSIATEVTADEKSREYSFIAPSGMVSLAIYIDAGATLTDFVCSVTLGYPNNAEESIADYYADEMADTISKVRNESVSPALVFLWSTDNHRYSSDADGVQNYGQMITNMKALAKEIKCDFVVDTGDLTDGNTTQATTLSRAYTCLSDVMGIGVPYLWSQGNHDTNYATSSHEYLFTMQECFKAYFTATKGMTFNASEYGTDYYVDCDWLNVRVISLNANNCTSNFEYAYGTSTATWLTDALNTQKTVILFVHQSPLTNQVYGNQSTTRASGVVTALETFVNNGGNLIMISGHSHRDVAFISPWVSIMQDCQRFSNTPSDIVDDGTVTEMSGFIGEIIKNARVQYTASEDLWTVGVYKPITNELSLIRFGAGRDRYFHVTPIAPATLTTKLTGTITWSSSDTAVATVADGVVTGAATGKCAVLATDESGNYECWIIVVT